MSGPDPGTGNIPEPRYSEIRAGSPACVCECGAPWESAKKPLSDKLEYLIGFLGGEFHVEGVSGMGV